MSAAPGAIRARRARGGARLRGRRTPGQGGVERVSGGFHVCCRGGGRGLDWARRALAIDVASYGEESLFANHRRNLDAFINEARQKMYSIREELEK